MAAYPVWSATGEQVIFLGRKTGDAKGDWWVLELKDKTVHPTGLLETFRKSGPAEPAGLTILRLAHGCRIRPFCSPA